MNPEQSETSANDLSTVSIEESVAEVSFDRRDESSQMSLIKPEVEPTGDSRIDAALDRMRDVAELPTVEHVEVFDEVHRRMQDLLADSSQ